MSRPRRPRRANIGRRDCHAEIVAIGRRSESQEQLEQRNIVNRERMARSRSRQYQEENRQRRRDINFNLQGVAFSYDRNIDYSAHRSVSIGEMDVICQYCKALKFKSEAPGMCCASGKVKLPELIPPPEELNLLVNGITPVSKHFLDNIQAYNSCFQMTSFGADKIISDNFMPTFKIQGQIYHLAGSLLPYADQTYKYLQIYFIGNNDEQIDQRCTIARSMRREIICELQNMYHEHNELVRLFKVALDRMPSDNHKIVIRADKVPEGQHARRFNAPTINDVAIVIVGNEQPRDIVLHRRNDELDRICETNRCYDALQYPILFPYGEDGYHFNIKMINPSSGLEGAKKVSAMNFYSYRIMIRENIENHMLKCRRLFHQYIVDMYVKIETERLNFIRFNQRKLRCEEYIHLRDAINNEDNVNNIGEMVILPSSYTGSPRHMHEYSQDGMAYVRRDGRPDFFITFTCNPQWSEIKKYLLPGQNPIDRHDITARIFKQKLRSLMDFIVKFQVFGEVKNWMYSIEWQKRGLPHAHILIWLQQKITSNQIDTVISAEIPDKTIDPILFDIVTKNMIHGPCGDLNRASQCMIDGKCSKNYPRALIADTITGHDGYPLYRRRSTNDNGKSVILKIKNEDVEVDNRWIVPYSPLLSKTFKAHINVEYCNSVKSIKYICKYINKGSDMAVFGVQNNNDEIKKYQLGRYVSSNEAVWRILSFPIHDRHPAVIHLAVHLENGQRVCFTPESARQIALEPPNTTLTAFFALCVANTFAKTLLYSEVPKYFTWNNSTKSFQARKQGKAVDGHPDFFSTDVLGRVYTVHPKQDECFYLRLLLINVRGPTSFNDLKTVNGQVCATYREACQLLNLLENDTHWSDTLAEASISAHPHQMRTLFAIIISTCSPSNPLELWNNHRDELSDDILHRLRVLYSNQNLQINADIYNEALILIEEICISIANKALIQLGMIAPNRSAQDLFNAEMRRELNYDCGALDAFVRSNVPKLNIEQKSAYDTIMHAVCNERGGMFFLDAPGGTGKTFLISLILATIRSVTQIGLALASSGIAATLLEGGRTAHSALKLKLNMHATESPTCKISKNSGMGKVLQKCKIIVWDECTMAHKKSLEALDRTLQDLRGNQRIFGGALILLAGDFRQTLPVIPRSTAADELNACLKSSYLWRHVKKLTLTTNVRVQLQNDTTAVEFSNQLLDIGNGKLQVDILTGLVTLPTNFCRMTQSKQELIESVFPNIVQQFKNHDWLSERAILAGTNKEVNDINADILNKIPTQFFGYKSIDTAMNQDDVVNYPTEFLNSIDLPGLPPHYLTLKVGVPIIMLRNINQPRLCNGTRLAVKRLLKNVIEATILKGKYKGEVVLIPRIPMIPPDLTFEFKRLQFPIRLAFAITINKSQGQSLGVCGINLEVPVFAHGQLYVACSRAGKPSALIILTDGKTKNIVYQKALE